MLKYVISVVVFAVMVSAQTNQWWPFSYSTCNFGTGGLGAQIDHMHIDAPIYHPGSSKFEVKARLIRALTSRVNATVVMYRTVSGLKAPVTCTILTIDVGLSVSIGSCSYPDLCDLAYTLMGVKDDKDNCPEWLVEEGFDCTCPWQQPAGKEVDLFGDIEITDLSQFGVAWLVSGNFDINVKATHANQPLLCLDLKAGIAPLSSGK